jgi:hypothetical protein
MAAASAMNVSLDVMSQSGIAEQIAQQHQLQMHMQMTHMNMQQGMPPMQMPVPIQVDLPEHLSLHSHISQQLADDLAQQMEQHLPEHVPEHVSGDDLVHAMQQEDDVVVDDDGMSHRHHQQQMQVHLGHQHQHQHQGQEHHQQHHHQQQHQHQHLDQLSQGYAHAGAHTHTLGDSSSMEFTLPSDLPPAGSSDAVTNAAAATSAVTMPLPDHVLMASHVGLMASDMSPMSAAPLLPLPYSETDAEGMNVTVTVADIQESLSDPQPTHNEHTTDSASTDVHTSHPLPTNTTTTDTA